MSQCHSWVISAAEAFRPSNNIKTVSKNFWLKIIKKENGREKPKKLASLSPESF